MQSAVRKDMYTLYIRAYILFEQITKTKKSNSHENFPGKPFKKLSFFPMAK